MVEVRTRLSMWRSLELVSYYRLSKQIMSKSSVPVVPGYFGDDQADSRLKDEAEKMGLV